jgi:hypothetical protein
MSLERDVNIESTIDKCKIMHKNDKYKNEEDEDEDEEDTISPKTQHRNPPPIPSCNNAIL